MLGSCQKRPAPECSPVLPAPQLPNEVTYKSSRPTGLTGLDSGPTGIIGLFLSLVSASLPLTGG